MDVSVRRGEAVERVAGSRRRRIVGDRIADPRHRVAIDVVRVEPRVPNVEVTHACESPHRLAVRPHDSKHGPGSLGLAEVALPRRHLETGCETLDVPLERARQGLVEIVEVEDQVALRRCEAAEIGEVRVARELDGEPGPDGRGQVVRHHNCRPAEEGEGRDEHATVTNWHEFRHTRAVLLFEQRNWVPIGGDLELCVARPGRLLAGGSAACASFRDCRVGNSRLG